MREEKGNILQRDKKSYAKKLGTTPRFQETSKRGVVPKLIKADKRLDLKTKKALISLIEEMTSE